MAKSDKKNTKIIELRKVAISYPSLFKKNRFKGKKQDNDKYECTFLIPKSDKQTKKMLDAAIEEAIKDKKGVKSVKKSNICIRDGDKSDNKDYRGHWTVKAGNKRRPVVLDRDGSPIDKDDSDRIYGGAICNGMIDFWVQDNDYGQKVNCNLYGVKFYKDGKPFGQGFPDVSDKFEEFADEKKKSKKKKKKSKK